MKKLANTSQLTKIIMFLKSYPGSSIDEIQRVCGLQTTNIHSALLWLENYDMVCTETMVNRKGKRKNNKTKFYGKGYFITK